MFVFVCFFCDNESNILFIYDVRDCAKLMVSFHSEAPESKLRAIYKKFCSTDRCAVALRTPAKNLSAESWIDSSLGGVILDDCLLWLETYGWFSFRRKIILLYDLYFFFILCLVWNNISCRIMTLPQRLILFVVELIYAIIEWNLVFANACVGLWLDWIVCKWFVYLYLLGILLG
jgi:hypothetical protein